MWGYFNLYPIGWFWSSTVYMDSPRWIPDSKELSSQSIKSYSSAGEVFCITWKLYPALILCKIDWRLILTWNRLEIDYTTRKFYIQHLSIIGSTGPRGNPGTNELSAFYRKHLVIQVLWVAQLKRFTENSIFKIMSRVGLSCLHSSAQCHQLANLVNLAIRWCRNSPGAGVGKRRRKIYVRGCSYIT